MQRVDNTSFPNRSINEYPGDRQNGENDRRDGRFRPDLGRAATNVGTAPNVQPGSAIAVETDLKKLPNL